MVWGAEVLDNNVSFDTGPVVCIINALNDPIWLLFLEVEAPATITASNLKNFRRSMINSHRVCFGRRIILVIRRAGRVFEVP